MSLKTLKMIAVSEENYLALKRLGSAGDSFNDVVTEVLKKVKRPLQTGLSLERPDQFVRDTGTTSESDSTHGK
jgi:predicted CopG family antitoxin